MLFGNIAISTQEFLEICDFTEKSAHFPSFSLAQED
jgi:hypothetical protein